MSRNITEKIKCINGRGIPVRGNDVDTDQIMPARFMKGLTFDDIGNYTFYDTRFNSDGSEKNHSLNDSRFEGGTILLVNANFGCGSSREHAPQALMRFGIEAIAGESFAEIFSGNCTAIGVPAITLESRDIEKIMLLVENNPAIHIRIDLEKNRLYAGMSEFITQQPSEYRNSLINGTWDSTSSLLSDIDLINSKAACIPYLNDFSVNY